MALGYNITLDRGRSIGRASLGFMTVADPKGNISAALPLDLRRAMQFALTASPNVVGIEAHSLGASGFELTVYGVDQRIGSHGEADRVLKVLSRHASVSRRVVVTFRTQLEGPVLLEVELPTGGDIWADQMARQVQAFSQNISAAMLDFARVLELPPRAMPLVAKAFEVLEPIMVSPEGRRELLRQLHEEIRELEAENERLWKRVLDQERGLTARARRQWEELRLACPADLCAAAWSATVLALEEQQRVADLPPPTQRRGWYGGLCLQVASGRWMNIDEVAAAIRAGGSSPAAAAYRRALRGAPPAPLGPWMARRGARGPR